MRSTSLSPPGSSRTAPGNGWMPKALAARANKALTQLGVARQVAAAFAIAATKRDVRSEL